MHLADETFVHITECPQSSAELFDDEDPVEQLLKRSQW